jgi:hypothetical protein
VREKRLREKSERRNKVFKDDSEIREAIQSGSASKIDDLFDGSQYGNGQLENMEGDIWNLKSFCSCLTRALVSKGVLTVKEAEGLFAGRQ